MSSHRQETSQVVDNSVLEEEDDADRQRAASIRTLRTLAFEPSSDDSDDEQMSSNFQDQTFQNILAVLVGRQSLGLSSLSQGYPRDTTSDSDSEHDGEFWRHRPQPAPPQPQPPDISEMEKAEITVLTQRSLVGDSRRGRPNLAGMIAKRSLCGQFTVRDKRLICGQLLPHNPKKVAQYKNKVFCGTHARDGDVFMTACQDRKLRIYDSSREKFTLKQTIEAQDVGWSILDVAVSPDGEHLVYSSWSDSLHQVSLLGSEEKHVALPFCPDDRQFCIFSVSFSCDSRELLGGANDGYLYLYDREANKQSSRIEAHEDDVNAVCFVDETTHVLASGGDDGLCKVWDRRSLREDDPRPVGILAGHVDGITYVDPRGDGRHLITNSKDQSIKLWDIRKFSNSDTIEMSKQAVSNQRWDYRWQRVPKHVGNSRTRLEGDTSVMTYTGHTVLQTLIRCHFSPQFSTGQRYIYTGCAAGRVVIYDLLTGKITKVLSGHKSCVRDVSWHPYSAELFSSSWDFSVNRWTGVESPDREEQEENAKTAQSEGKRRKVDKSCL
eukprot:GFUD01039523.1.p1 GENE.GFUD01039523.1~~GFUD01039523.1.p1  ORF type:complete len:551 (+),score=151.78 GFUD01039523.1:103-1755(+)